MRGSSVKRMKCQREPVADVSGRRTLVENSVVIAEERLVVGLAAAKEDELALVDLLLPRAEELLHFL